MDMHRVLDFLSINNIAYTLYRHEPTVSVEDSNRIICLPGTMGCKSLLLKDKKSERYFMAVLPNDKRADMRGLARYVGSEKFEFASEDKLTTFLGVKRGNVSPFCFLNPPSDSVGLLLDREVAQAPVVRFHPCDNTATVVLGRDEFAKCITLMGKNCIITD